jgi:hypothetical protein
MQARWGGAGRWTLAALLAAPAAGAQDIVTDRPDFTESAEVVPGGRQQVEAGYTFARHAGRREHAAGELLVRLSLGERLEGRIGLNSYAMTRAAGLDHEDFEDPSLGIKLEPLPRGGPPWMPSVAVILAATLARGAASTAQAFEPEAKLCMAWEPGGRLGLSANLNAADVDAGSELSGSVSLACELGDRWGGYLEAFGFAPSIPGEERTGYLNGGITFLVDGDLQLDVRAGAGLNGVHPDHFVGAGIARRW